MLQGIGADDEAIAPVPSPAPPEPSSLTSGAKALDIMEQNATEAEDVNQFASSAPCPCADSAGTGQGPAPAPYSVPPTTARDADPLVLSPLSAPSAEEKAKINQTRAMAMRDCIVSEWSEWTACARQKSSGMDAARQLHTRTIVQPQLEGGVACPPLEEYRTCMNIGTLARDRLRTDAP